MQSLVNMHSNTLGDIPPTSTMTHKQKAFTSFPCESSWLSCSFHAALSEWIDAAAGVLYLRGQVLPYTFIPVCVCVRICNIPPLAWWTEHIFIFLHSVSMQTQTHTLSALHRSFPSSTPWLCLLSEVADLLLVTNSFMWWFTRELNWAEWRLSAHGDARTLDTK